MALAISGQRAILVCECCLRDVVKCAWIESAGKREKEKKGEHL